MTQLPHLRLEKTNESVPYTYAGQARGGEFTLPPRDRVPHARRLRNEINEAQREAQTIREAQGAEDEGAGEILAIRSDENFELKLDSIERRRSGIELVSVGRQEGVTVANVFVPRGKHVILLRLIAAYETERTEKGAPKNQKLVESIASIRLAAVRDLWQDKAALFPAGNEPIWWEVWLRAGTDAADVHERFRNAAARLDFRVSPEYVPFPERVVTHGFGNLQQLSSSLDLLSLLAELRRAKELATDYVELEPRDQREVINELLGRLQGPTANAPAVCILDTGVNRAHPLLAPFLADADTQTIKSEWGAADDTRQHGTGMAGIALYGSLAELFANNEPIAIRHRLESVKILPPPPGANDEKDYGPFTIQAVALAEIRAPERKRALCMAVTADDRDLGMPSLWSAAIDQMCSGASDDGQRLMFISAGNIETITQANYIYHRSNAEHGIQDPSQAWNAITVGAFTEMVRIQDPDFDGWHPIAPSGDINPTSRTSLSWPEESKRGWPLKPDVVMEGGNYAELGIERSNCPDLSLLTTTLPRFGGRLLEITFDTSPATAAAARLAAQIWAHYPNLWPETIRGLVVHSAQWTDAMVRRYPGVTKTAIQDRIRCYGYGVPDLEKALWSVENAATLLYEGEIQPYTRREAGVASNEMHLHRIPWPTEALQELGETDVTMRVTLAYFIEPSPGRIGWGTKHRYQSHGLRFDVNRPEEDETAFRQRISRAEWEEGNRPDNVAETREWTVGDQGRRHGSIHSDWWTGTASQLASSNFIAVYPVTGWWRERPHLNRVERRARYSLIITIQTPDAEVDLYTPIATQAAISTEVEAD